MELPAEHLMIRDTVRKFIDALPKIPTERVQKFELRKFGIGEAWDREKAGYKLKRV